MGELLEVVKSCVPDGAEYVGAFDPRSVVDDAFREPLSFSYAHSPVRVFRQKLGDGAVRFDAVSDHAPLNGDQLLTLTEFVAPGDSVSTGPFVKESLNGTIGDWKILDRNDSPGDYTKHLLEIHGDIGGPWLEFAQSQPTLIGLLRDVRRPYAELYDDKVTKLRSIFSAKHELESEIVRLAVSRPERITELCTELGTEADTEGLILRAVAKQVSRGTGKRNHIRFTEQTRDELWRRFQAIPREKKTRMVQGLLRESNAIRQSGLMTSDVAFHEAFDTLEVDKRRLTYPWRKMEKGMTLARAYEQREEVIKGNYGVDILYIPNPLTAVVEKLRVPGSFSRRTPYRQVQPHIAWKRKADGSSNFIIERVTPTDEGIVAVDGVLGVLVAAYLSPVVRAQWPAQMKIRDRNQTMRAAQVPVQAMMFQESLLAAPFVRQVEAFADAA